ncbi:MAG: hypothetical protein ABI696_01795 [Rubrivivax sp.]
MFPLPRWRRRRPRQSGDYPPASLLQRLTVLAAAVLVTVVVGLALLAPQLHALRARHAPPPDRPLCGPGQQTDCVGGTMTVIITPAPGAAGPSGAASAPR